MCVAAKKKSSCSYSPFATIIHVECEPLSQLESRVKYMNTNPLRGILCQGAFGLIVYMPICALCILHISIYINFCSFLAGSENRFRHEFNGYLAGLSYLANAVEHTEVLRCLHQCAESLQVISLEDFFFGHLSHSQMYSRIDGHL